jgi:RNA 2',3'-cyclic 3'-phosphodiesterase
VRPEAEPPPASGSEGKAIRAFVALPLPEILRDGVADTIERLRRRLPDVRFVRAEGAHVTLRFLGWTRAEVLERMAAPLRAAAEACPPLEVGARGLGTFPERGSPRVLWIGLEMPPPVRALQAACEASAVAAGFEPEPRAFHPHLTLGRWKDRARRPDLPDVDLGSGRVETLVLFRSQLRSSGSEYTPLSVFPLRGHAAAVE